MAASTARPAVATKAASKPAVGSKSGPIPNLGTNDLVESYVPARLPEGMVTGVWGRAIIRPAGGQPRPLVVGDEVRKGDMILTSQNGIVQIKHDGTRMARVPDGESLENVIVAVNAGDAPPGAGGASGGSLQPGLRVDRLYEVVSAQDYAFDATQAGTGLAVRADVDNGVPTVATVEPGAPGAGDDAVPEGTAAANTLVYTVTLTRATTTVLTLPISIGGGTASADDYSGTATFSNGVTRNADGTINVPAGVSSFTISIPTAPDATVEVDETVPVVVGGVLGTGVITNDDTAPVAADDAGAVTQDAQLTVSATDGVILSSTVSAGRDLDVDLDPLTVTAVRTGAETGSGTAGSVGTALVGTYGSLTLNADGSYSYVADRADALGLGVTATDTFTYTVSDGHGNVDSAQLVITVTGANDLPVTVGSLADQASQDGAAVTFPTASGFTDPDSGDTLSYSATGLPTGLSIDTTTGVISGTLPSNASVTDPYAIVVTASDGHGGSVTQTFTLTVTNPAPVAADDAGAVTEDASLSVTAANGVVLSGATSSGRDSDPDGDTLTVTSVRTGAETGSGTAGSVGSALVGTYGSLTLNTDGSYSYVANNANSLALGVTATDTFTYTVSDGQGGSDSAQLVITVTGTNDAPTPQADGLGANGNGTNEDTPASGNVLTNDLDVDTPAASLRVVSFTIDGVGNSTVYSAGTTVTVSGVGRFTLAADGSYSFVPAADYNNSSATAPVVHYTLTDGLAEATSQLKLQVTAVPDTITSSARTWENRSVVVDVLANDTFADSAATITHLNGQPVTAGSGTAIPVLQDGVQVGTVSLGSDGKVTFEPAIGYTNVAGHRAVFTYTVSAGGTTEVGDASIQVDQSIALTELTPTKYWTFDNASGSTVSDESATTQQGTLTSGATLSAGHIGQAVVLNGSSGYVNLANASTTTDLLEGKGGMSASLAFWVKLDPGQTGGSVIGANSASTIDPGSNLGWGQVSADGYIGLVRGNQAVYGSTAINDGQWHHVVISYAQSPTDSKIQSATIWVDGALDGSGFTFADGLLGVEFTGFGINNAKSATDGTSTYFKGTLDDIRVYSGVLSEDQVVAIHTAEAAQSGNSSADRLVLDNDQGSVSFAVAGNPLFIHLSGVPNGAKLTDGVNEVTIGTSGEASITNPAGWNLQSLSLEGLGSRSALVSVDATLSDGSSTVGKMTIDVVAGHSATTAADTWTSGSGSDVFAWTLSDAGSAGSPGQDKIEGFNASSTVTAGGDVLDLRDLLVGEHAAAGAYNLENFLHVELPSGSATSTTLHVSSSGGFAGGSYAAGQETQVIELTQTQLASALGLATDATESAILKAMVEQGKLVVDP